MSFKNNIWTHELYRAPLLHNSFLSKITNKDKSTTYKYLLSLELAEYDCILHFKPSQSKQVDTSMYHIYICMKIFKDLKNLAQVLDRSSQLSLTGNQTSKPKEPLGRTKKDSLKFMFKSRISVQIYSRQALRTFFVHKSCYQLL